MGRAIPRVNVALVMKLTIIQCVIFTQSFQETLTQCSAQSLVKKGKISVSESSLIFDGEDIEEDEVKAS